MMKKTIITIAVAISTLVDPWANKAEAPADDEPPIAKAGIKITILDPELATTTPKLTSPPKKMPLSTKRRGGQCVVFVQNYLSTHGNEEFRGRADQIQPNSDIPEVGSAVLLREGPVGHVAVITKIDEHYLTLIESNLYGDEMIVEGRQIRRDAEIIRGYFSFKQP